MGENFSLAIENLLLLLKSWYQPPVCTPRNTEGGGGAGSVAAGPSSRVLIKRQVVLIDILNFTWWLCPNCGSDMDISITHLSNVFGSCQ